MDFNFLKQIFTNSFFQFYLITYVFGKDGKCIRKNSTDVNDKVCCAYYEMINGTCNECRKGFISESGSSCEPCTNNLFGEKCLQSCKCTDNQTCHHILGCISLESTSVSTMLKGSTGLYPWITASDTKMQEIENNESKHGSGPFDQAITIYSVCIAGFLVVIAISFICFNRLQRSSTEQLKDCNRQQNEFQNEPNLILNIQENMASLESIYHEID